MRYYRHRIPLALPGDVNKINVNYNCLNPKVLSFERYYFIYTVFRRIVPRLVKITPAINDSKIPEIVDWPKPIKNNSAAVNRVLQLLKFI